MKKTRLQQGNYIYIRKWVFYFWNSSFKNCTLTMLFRVSRAKISLDFCQKWNFEGFPHQIKSNESVPESVISTSFMQVKKTHSVILILVHCAVALAVTAPVPSIVALVVATVMSVVVLAWTIVKVAITMTARSTPAIIIWTSLREILISWFLFRWFLRHSLD